MGGSLWLHERPLFLSFLNIDVPFWFLDGGPVALENQCIKQSLGREHEH